MDKLGADERLPECRDGIGEFIRKYLVFSNILITFAP